MPSVAANPSVQPQAGVDDRATARAGAATHPEAGRIGQILVEDGLLSMEQLSKALRIQARLEDRKPIGMLVVELGWVTRSRLELALRRHRHGLSVEGILVERGVIRSGQLAAAMEALKEHPNKSPGVTWSKLARFRSARISRRTARSTTSASSTSTSA